MKKRYIKLNIDDNHLTLGNFCRLLKEYAVNKSAALQVEIFSSLMGNVDIQDTTVNNYCIGCRSIGDEYKQIYLNLKKKFLKDNKVMIDIESKILSILCGTVNTNINIEDVNNNKRLSEFLNKLYNISKNDINVNKDVSNSLYNLIKENKLYDCLAEILFFIILEAKQPLYEEAIKQEIIENILSQTEISSNDLSEYLNLKLIEGSNYYYSLKKLAIENNAYACYEMGSLEYEGTYKGYPRYEESYRYFLSSSSKGHPGAYYYLGRLFYNKFVGSGNKEEMKYAFDMFTKAMELGSINAINSIGLYYLKGIYPVSKDIAKAKEYFLLASDKGCVYAHNNLGLIKEDEKDLESAFSYYLKSALEGESWACNKVGEMYRLGIGTNKDLKGAFKYHNLGIEGPSLYINYYNYYNLAIYFYLDGCMDVVLRPDLNKAISYLKEASNHDIIEASIKLLYLKIDEYLKNKEESTLKEVYEYKNIIEKHSNYNIKLKNEINEKLKKMKENNEIDLKILLN